MTSNSIGNDSPQDRIDANHNKVADASERAFAQSAEVQKSPADAPSDQAERNAEARATASRLKGKSQALD